MSCVFKEQTSSIYFIPVKYCSSYLHCTHLFITIHSATNKMICIYFKKSTCKDNQITGLSNTTVKRHHTTPGSFQFCTGSRSQDLAHVTYHFPLNHPFAKICSAALNKTTSTKQRFQMVWQGEKFYRHQKCHLTRPTNVHFSQLAGINCHDVHTNLNYCIHNLFSFIASLIRYFKTGPSNMRYLSGIFRDT